MNDPNALFECVAATAHTTTESTDSMVAIITYSSRNIVGSYAALAIATHAAFAKHNMYLYHSFGEEVSYEEFI